MADAVDDSSLVVGPFVVISNHMGYKKWSRDFETLNEAGQCFDRVTRSMGRPEQVDGRYSFWYEYGAHGERIQVVHSALQFRDAMKHAGSFDQIVLMRKYGVNVEATRDFWQKFQPKFDEEGNEIHEKRGIMEGPKEEDMQDEEDEETPAVTPPCAW